MRQKRIISSEKQVERAKKNIYFIFNKEYNLLCTGTGICIMLKPYS